jgi:hypothetical protein
VIRAMFYWLMLGACVVLTLWMTCDLVMGPQYEPHFSAPDLLPRMGVR